MIPKHGSHRFRRMSATQSGGRRPLFEDKSESVAGIDRNPIETVGETELVNL